MGLVCASCGRLAFDPLGDGASSAGSDSDSDSASSTPWRIAQTTSAQSNTVPLRPVAAGNTLIAAIQGPTSDVVAGVSDDVGESFVAIPAAHPSDGSELEVWYVAHAVGGAQVLTISMVSGAAPKGVVVWEVANLRAPQPLDTALPLIGLPASLNPIGPPLTTSEVGEFVITFTVVSFNVIAIHAGNEFTEDTFTDGNGWAHLTDPRAPPGMHSAEWDCDTVGGFASTAVSFFPGP
jgi:hypothetical protein